MLTAFTIEAIKTCSIRRSPEVPLLLSPLELASESLLGTSKSSFVSLAILASLRKDDHDAYFHAGLAERIGEDLLPRVLATLHAQVFYGWLNTPWVEQRLAVDGHLRDIGWEPVNQAEPSFTQYVPDSAELPERKLFKVDLAVILMLLRADRCDCGAASRLADRYLEPILRKAKSAAYNVELTLRDLGKALGVSPNYLGHIFHHHTGVKFREYLLAGRMSIATDILRAQAGTLNLVASSLGYRDKSNFFRDFRRVLRKRPTSFRLCSR